jgi:hypothetical protein
MDDSPATSVNIFFCNSFNVSVEFHAEEAGG